MIFQAKNSEPTDPIIKTIKTIKTINSKPKVRKTYAVSFKPIPIYDTTRYNPMKKNGIGKQTKKSIHLLFDILDQL
jgi:hypothetical protein